MPNGTNYGPRLRTRTINNNQNFKKTKNLKFKIGTLNIITLTGKSEECIDLMKERQLGLLGLSETKWRGKGEKELRDGFFLYWSGGEGAKNGVAFIINHKLKERLEDVTYISDRIIQMKVRINQDRSLTFLQCYAPQTGLSDEEKERFEEKLEDYIRDENTIVMGDLNAQVGSERLGFETSLGPYGWGPRNNEGIKLLDLCLRNELVLGNSWFKKRDSHRITRYGWDGVQKSVIDYFLVNKNFKKHLIDVKVIPSVALDSDHRLLVAMLKFDKYIVTNQQQERKLKVWKLKNESVRVQFQNMIINSMPIEGITTVEEEWMKLKTSFIRATEITCGRTSAKRRWKETAWWNDRVKNAVLHKNKSFRAYFKHRSVASREQYQTAKREAKQIVKEERRK